MKKLLTVLLMVLLTLSMAACSGSGNGGSKSAKVIDDNGALRLHFKAPEGYESVERVVIEDLNGNVTEKDINYYYEDGREVDFAYIKGTVLGDMIDLSQLEAIEMGGNTWYYYPYGSNYMAFIQLDDDLGGVNYVTSEDDGRENLEKLLEGVTISDSLDTAVDDHDLYDIKYELDDSLPLYEYTVTTAEKADGTRIRKTVAWYYGSEDETLYRLLIRVHFNELVENLYSGDYEYVEKEINGNVFIEQVNDSGAPYNYYIQHGEDVYQIRNNGASNGWFTSRSEESEKAFEALLNSVSFK